MAQKLERNAPERRSRRSRSGSGKCLPFQGGAWALLCLAGLLLCTSSPAPAAEPYLRVSKNGVIYYFFANSRERNTLPGRLVASRLRPRPQPPRRLTTQELEPLIQEVSRYHNLPPSLIKAVIQVESNFNAAAISPKGAQGLMQLMPETADLLQVSNPYNIRENIWGGSRYLRMLLDKFNNRLPLALAAYNAGPQQVDQHREVPPIQETQHFVRDVCRNFLKYAEGKPGRKKD